MEGRRLIKGSLMAAMLGLYMHAAAAGPLEWVSAQLNEAEEAEVDKLVLPMPEHWLGDFDGMRERRLIRVLVPYSKTYYLVARGQQHGISYELGKALEDWLNRTQPLPTRSLRWQVMFIPVARDELLPRLNNGGGDIAAGGLTITEERLKAVDFAEPFNTHVREALITGPESKSVSSLQDLAGQDVTVRASSSYYEHLAEINKQFKARGIVPINVIPADENLETEDLLEMLNAGLLNAVVADRYIAEAWSPLYTDLKIHDEFYIHKGAHFAWAIRKNSPLLKHELDSFVSKHKDGTAFGMRVYKKYVKNSKRVLNAVSETEMKKFKELVALFEKHAGTYDFDYLMLMAQGFQESHLNQSARSPRGAVGIMQLLPSTAADPSVGVHGIEASADKNIEAGSKYMRVLADKYLNDPDLTPMNRTLLAFAAYNAGPGNLRKFRRLAEKSGLDKNVWFGNVEHAAARVVGRETVDYVGNIYKYYIAYKLAEEKNRHRAALRKTSAAAY
jgi:membrane-bound lytic murein transglycosylase MltF